MKDFAAQVLRERFVITPVDGETDSIIALSNRAPLTLIDGDGRIVEKLVIRGHMLHSVVRMMGSLVNTFNRTGPLFNRQIPLDWDQVWDISAGPHERAYNADLWIAVYHNGKIVYQNGQHHSFLDVVEQCDARGNGNYDAAIKFAETLFNKAGKPVTITYDSTIATTFNIGKLEGRAALILRGAQKTTTFSYTGETKDIPDRHLNPVHFINAAAAFLEGIQLSFTIGSGNEKLRREIFSLYSDDGLLLTSARTRLGESNATIRTFENLHIVHYRPERPDFPTLITNAEGMTRKRLDEEEAAAEAAAAMEEDQKNT